MCEYDLKRKVSCASTRRRHFPSHRCVQISTWVVPIPFDRRGWLTHNAQTKPVCVICCHFSLAQITHTTRKSVLFVGRNEARLHTGLSPKLLRLLSNNRMCDLLFTLSCLNQQWDARHRVSKCAYRRAGDLAKTYAIGCLCSHNVAFHITGPC